MSTWQVWLWGLGAAQTLMVVTWLISVARRDASVVDRVWGLAFVLLAWAYVGLADAWEGRPMLVAALVTIWGLRLSGYITWRNWGHGEDPRYAAMRKKRPNTFAIRSLVTVFVLQGVLAWLISLPLLAVATRPAPIGWLDIVAVVVWAIGLYFEAVGDWQLSRFRADPANRGTVLDTGLWRTTRHPNYFGDTVVWVSYALFALATGIGGAYGVIGTVLMGLFIVKVSGVALTEKRMGSSGSKREGYDSYVARTNAFFPGPPKARP